MTSDGRLAAPWRACGLSAPSDSGVGVGLLPAPSTSLSAGAAALGGGHPRCDLSSPPRSSSRRVPATPPFAAPRGRPRPPSIRVPRATPRCGTETTGCPTTARVIAMGARGVRDCELFPARGRASAVFLAAIPSQPCPAAMCARNARGCSTHPGPRARAGDGRPAERAVTSCKASPAAGRLGGGRLLGHARGPPQNHHLHRFVLDVLGFGLCLCPHRPTGRNSDVGRQQLTRSTAELSAKRADELPPPLVQIAETVLRGARSPVFNTRARGPPSQSNATQSETCSRRARDEDQRAVMRSQQCLTASSVVSWQP